MSVFRHTYVHNILSTQDGPDDDDDYESYGQSHLVGYGDLAGKALDESAEYMPSQTSQTTLEYTRYLPSCLIQPSPGGLRSPSPDKIILLSLMIWLLMLFTVDMPYS